MMRRKAPCILQGVDVQQARTLKEDGELDGRPISLICRLNELPGHHGEVYGISDLMRCAAGCLRYGTASDCRARDGIPEFCHVGQ